MLHAYLYTYSDINMCKLTKLVCDKCKQIHGYKFVWCGATMDGSACVIESRIPDGEEKAVKVAIVNWKKSTETCTLCSERETVPMTRKTGMPSPPPEQVRAPEPPRGRRHEQDHDAYDSWDEFEDRAPTKKKVMNKDPYRKLRRNEYDSEDEIPHRRMHKYSDDRAIPSTNRTTKKNRDEDRERSKKRHNNEKRSKRAYSDTSSKKKVRMKKPKPWWAF